MKITDFIHENAFGHLVNFKLSEPEIPSKNYLIFLHGQGECGPNDGSALGRVCKHGYPKHAVAGFEFPFNIVAPQVASSYSILRIFFPAFVKMKFNAEVIIVTGLSMGGFATFDMRQWDDHNLIHAIAPVCGGASAAIAGDYPETIGWAFHGEADTTVRYNRSKAFVDAYNEIHDTKMAYTLYPGVGHNAWDKAYSVAPDQDELLRWIITEFNAAPRPTDIRKKLIDFINSL